MKDAVENLAQAYLNIRREGCIQFDDFYVVITQRKEKVTERRLCVEVKLPQVEKVLRGWETPMTTVMYHVTSIYEYMNECVEKWRRELMTKRE